MPATYVIDAASRTVLFVLRGAVTLRELAHENARLTNDPAFDPGFSELVDFTAVSEVELGDADSNSLQELDPFFPSSKRALVIGPQSSIQGTARMYQMMRRDEHRIEIFKNRKEALRWLAAS
jgi:hypothetical protein